MFIVLLSLSENKSKAGELMDGHNQWIQQGFDDGVFLVVGSLKPNLGGGVVATNTSLDELRERVDKDPFVTEKVVVAEILEIDPVRTDERLQFLIQ
jgi:uncharacterized protein YciI